MNLEFLETYNEHTLGPIQKAEALFLRGLCEMLQIKIVLEYGVLLGQSTRVWVNSGCEKIIGVDLILSDEVKELAVSYPALELYQADMKTFLPPVYDYDLVFIDASHRLKDNKAVIYNLERQGVLKDNVIIALHDTGHWKKELMGKDQWWFKNEFGGIEEDDIVIHHPDEKKTIEWIAYQYPDWQRMDFWTTKVLRYGITLFKI